MGGMTFRCARSAEGKLAFPFTCQQQALVVSTPGCTIAARVTSRFPFTCQHGARMISACNLPPVAWGFLSVPCVCRTPRRRTSHAMLMRMLSVTRGTYVLYGLMLSCLALASLGTLVPYGRSASCASA